MTSRPDVVVVGAGLGGLSCAADLANRGASVLLLERHGLVGGYASSFTRGRFTFDVSQHSVGGLDEGQSFHRLLDRLGVAGDVGVARPRNLATMIAGDAPLALPNDPDACFEALVSLSPSDEEGLRELIDACVAIHRDTVAGALEGDMRRLVRGMRLAGNRSFAQALGEKVRGPALASVLSLPWVLLGLPPSRASFSWFAKVLATTFVEGTAHIVGGGQALADALAGRVRSAGGEVRTGEAARRILLEQGRVLAVETQTGEMVETTRVVCNLDPWAMEDLIETDVDVDFEAEGEPSLSMVAVWLGLRGKASDLGIPEGATFVAGDPDPERSYRASLRGDAAATDLVFSNPGTLDPGHAPEGRSAVHGVVLVNGRPWFDLEGATYRKRKEEVTEALLGRLEALWPGIRAAAEVVEVGTPRTMHAYTRNHVGAVYGLAQTPPQSGAGRPAAATRIPGLWRTGAWVLPGGGYSASTLSGIMTARDVARSLGRTAQAPRTDSVEGRDSFPVHVWYEDTDTGGVAYHLSYLRFFDRARTELFGKYAGQQGLDLPRAVVSRIEVDYRRPAALGDDLVVRTTARFESDLRAVFRQEAHRGDDLLASATTEMTFVDEEGQPAPCPIRAELEEAGRMRS